MQSDLILGNERVEVEFLDPPFSFLGQWQRVFTAADQAAVSSLPIARVAVKWIPDPWSVLRLRWSEAQDPDRQPPILEWDTVVRSMAARSRTWHTRFDGPLSATLYDPATRSIEAFRLIPSDFDLSPNTLLVPALQPAFAARGSLLVHAAGVDLGGFGVIVTGPSGVWKSTAARLLGGHILSDDMVLVSGIGHRPMVFSTPLGRVTDGIGHCPLGGVLFPEKADSFRLGKLGGREASLRFFVEHSSYMVVNTFESLRREILRLSSCLFDDVPSFVMSFSKEHIDSTAVSAAITSTASTSP